MKPNLDQILDKRVVNLLLILFWSSVFTLAAFAYQNYSGNGYFYILFSIVSNLLLFFGFRKESIHFDTFIGIFFWLGFWLKFSLRIAFFDGDFREAVGYFDGSGAAFDQALLVASCGLSGFLLASYIRGKIFFKYPEKIQAPPQRGLFGFYKAYRKIIWVGFAAIVTIVATTNAYLGIYQRGSITQTILPFGANGVYKWLLLFGLATISALIIKFEFEIKKTTALPIMALSFFENLMSNISMLSRGMILNGGALFYGVLSVLKPNSIKSNLRFFIVAGLIFSVLFLGSVLAVNYMRSTVYWDHVSDASQNSANRLKLTQKMTSPLFIDRWVGMEGVLAVSSYPNLGWDLWRGAWQEKYDEKSISYYDSLIQSDYIHVDTSKHHFISLPGVIAFFFYPGSFLFLFCSMFVLGSTAALVEAFVFYLGGRNLILCALIAQVIAFRFASFGYVPKQSYLLFGTIILNLLIIYLADKVFARFPSKRIAQAG